MILYMHFMVKKAHIFQSTYEYQQKFNYTMCATVILIGCVGRTSNAKGCRGCSGFANFCVHGDSFIEIKIKLPYNCTKICS